MNLRKRMDKAWVALLLSLAPVMAVAQPATGQPEAAPPAAPAVEESAAAKCVRTIDDAFASMTTTLEELTGLEQQLAPAAANYLEKARFARTVQRQLDEALAGLAARSSNRETFEHNVKSLVDQVDGLQRPPEKAALSEQARLSNISVTIQNFRQAFSAAEQQSTVDETAKRMEQELTTVQQLVASQIEKRKELVQAGDAFLGLVRTLDAKDNSFLDQLKILHKARAELEIANRIARAAVLVPEEPARKVAESKRMEAQAALVATRAATALTRELRGVDRSDKLVRTTVLEVVAKVDDLEARHPGWFNKQRMNIFVALLLLSGAILYFIWHAQSGTKLFIRRIAGLSALDDAVGRATEMGRPILFVTGIRDIDDVQTLAGVSILALVARKAAEYDTKLFVPCCMPLAHSMSQEVVRESYLRAGRPDAYNPETVRFLTSDQFGFVAGCDGIMVRERVAACFYLGKFYAESLILAETGNSIGAIQIAGTAETAQLPFFVAACDYTLIGEELFAASAYLSGEPRLLGSLKGQDVGKGIMIVCIIVGVAVQILISYGYLPETVSVTQIFAVR